MTSSVDLLTDAGVRMACRRCHVVVFPHRHPDGHVEWAHGRMWEEYDHDPEPAPAVTVGLAVPCDFCAVLGAQWEYLGSDLTTAGLHDTGQVVPLKKMPGRWTACHECDRFVRRGDLAGLTAWAESQPGLVHADRSDTAAAFSRMSAAEITALKRRHRQQLWRAFIGSIYRRSPLPPPPPPLTDLRISTTAEGSRPAGELLERPAAAGEYLREP